MLLLDHDILIERVEHSVGIGGLALCWFICYIKHRAFTVNIGTCSSTPAAMTSGGPQGSILGPLLFSLYMLPLGEIIRKQKVSFHCYAHDLQLYLPLSLGNLCSISRLSDCIIDIETWMAHSLLQLNASKTEVILFGHSKQIEDPKGTPWPSILMY